VRPDILTPRRRALWQDRKPPRWQWEIKRRPKPLGVKLYANGFKSEKAAKLAGERALRELLDGIARELSKGADPRFPPPWSVEEQAVRYQRTTHEK